MKHLTPVQNNHATGQWGIEIVDLDSDESLLQLNAQQLFIPASVTKIFSSAAALKQLGPDYRFVTQVLVGSDTLILQGGGDPTLEASDLEQMAQEVYDHGIRQVKNGVGIDDSWLHGTQLPTQAEWEDLTWFYGAEINALSVDDNAVKIKINPVKDELARITLEEKVPYFTIVNQLWTTSDQSKCGTEERSSIKIRRGLSNNTIHLSGYIWEQSETVEEKIAVHQPAEYARQIFVQALRRKGVQVSDHVPNYRGDEKVIIEKKSPPLSTILHMVNKDSHNLATELMIRTIGQQRSPSSVCYVEEGLKAIYEQIEGSCAFYDGVGLSRQNLCTPNQIVSTLKNVYHSQYKNDFIESLAIAGVDGTLTDSFKDTFWKKRIFAKTGTLSQVANLAGYVFTPAGKNLAFCICVNQHLYSAEECRNKIEHLLVNSLKEIDEIF